MAGTDNPLALDNQVCFALYAANRAVTARYRPLLAELNLTYPQYLVMLVLWEGEDAGDVIRVSDLGHRLRLDSGTLTPLLKRLAERGLIERRRSEQDERVVTVSLTDQGRSLKAQARSVPERLLCGLGVDEGRLMALRKELRAVLKSLEASAPND
ncbi:MULTISPECIES: MarR family winged helix-turn-helix transcriptional regulator [Marinobacter]|uniref:MarR family transcriptional regulator n=1 Tax=Marinobacter suaedae TaxID=3057675 RepID=A0ABT8W2N5_9GAMM|nr:MULTISPECIES: MarR family transcriptional regulator [unclassified Marinobacter]MBZ2167762.1 MarR family transcriptional regulator [Marinobacter sp. F4216]MDO3722506.1 MarR family transcriptional regulator [Marinobacter sp. chi1]